MMRKIATLTAMALAFIVVAGCNKPASSVEGTGGKKITLVDVADQTMKRGEKNKVLITVTRTNINDPLDVTFEHLPKGVTVEEKDKKIATNENFVNYTLMAAGDADLVTNHEVKVTVAHGDIKVSDTFKLTVKENK